MEKNRWEIKRPVLCVGDKVNCYFHDEKFTDGTLEKMVWERGSMAQYTMKFPCNENNVRLSYHINPLGHMIYQELGKEPVIYYLSTEQNIELINTEPLQDFINKDTRIEELKEANAQIKKMLHDAIQRESNLVLRAMAREREPRMKLIFRPVRGGLNESLREQKEFNSFKEMYDYILDKYQSLIAPTYSAVLGISLYNDNLNPLGEDKRIGWECTFIVCLPKGKGACGYFTIQKQVPPLSRNKK